MCMGVPRAGLCLVLPPSLVQGQIHAQNKSGHPPTLCPGDVFWALARSQLKVRGVHQRHRLAHPLELPGQQSVLCLPLQGMLDSCCPPSTDQQVAAQASNSRRYKWNCQEGPPGVHPTLPWSLGKGGPLSTWKAGAELSQCREQQCGGGIRRKEAGLLTLAPWRPRLSTLGWR